MVVSGNVGIDIAVALFVVVASSVVATQLCMFFLFGI
jgi:hypothetical protein